MYELYDFISKKDQYDIGKDMLLEIRDAYNFEVIKAICFTHNRNYPYVRIACKKERRVDNIEYNYMLNIENISKSFFSLIWREKKVLFYTYNKTDGNQGYLPLNKKAKTEVYFPLSDSESNDVIGCIYLCSKRKVKINKSKFISDYRLANLNSFILLYHNEIQQSNKIVSYLKLFDDFLIKNNPHVLRHHYNVAYLSSRIADEMNLTIEDKFNLYYASLLHDAGEIYINGNILNKREKLTNAEYKIIKNHVNYGANLAKQLLDDDENKDVIINMIMQHHERFDGKGYPNGLKGEEIDIKSRIISVADAVDSMISGRSYKAAKSTEKIIQELVDNSGTQFDPEIVNHMIKFLNDRTSAKSTVEDLPIVVSTLSVFSKDSCILVQGTLIKKETLYEFHPNYASDLDIVEWSKVSQLTLSYVANRDIFEYDAKFLEIKDGILYLYELEVKSAMNSYSLLWELEGLLHVNESMIIPVRTTRISGDAVVFIVSREASKAIQINKLYKFYLYFTDIDSENMTGMVSQKYNIGQDCLNYFTFYNTPEALKDRIMKRIFKKQAELKRQITVDLK